MSPRRDKQEILVIKHGALGDVVFALPAMRAIRAHHKDARITLQTTPPFAQFLAASDYADFIDPRGRERGLAAGLALVRRMRQARYDLVYDLQRSDRTALLHLFVRQSSGPEWCGPPLGEAKRRKAANRRAGVAHVIDALAEQIAAAGVAAPLARRAPDVSWAVARGAQASGCGECLE